MMRVSGLSVVLCALWILFASGFHAFAQETPSPTLTPTTPPFIATVTPANPENTFNSVFARFEASTQSPLTGEPFMLSLVVSLPEGAFIAEWPEIGGTWGVFEIRAAGGIIENGQETRQDFTAVLWRPEDAVTVETFISYGSGGADFWRVPVRELIFSVPTVLDPDDEILRPPLPPFFADWPLPALVMIAGVLAAAASVIWTLWPEAEVSSPLTPAQITLNKLRAVARRSPEIRFHAALALLRDLYIQRPYTAIEPVIATGEALAYTGAALDLHEAAMFYDRAVHAVQEIAHE